MPLPAGSLGDWPYPDLFPSGREQYLAEVLPRRITLIREWADRHRPRTIFCYGTKYWPYHREIFPMDDFRSVSFTSDKRPVRLGFGTWHGVRVVLTPFFQPDQLPFRVVAELPRYLASAVA